MCLDIMKTGLLDISLAGWRGGMCEKIAKELGVLGTSAVESRNLSVLEK